MIVAALPTPTPQAVDPTQGTVESSRDVSGTDLALDDAGKLGFGKRLQRFIDGPAADAAPRAASEPVKDTPVDTAIPTDVVVCGVALPPADDPDVPKAAKDDVAKDATTGDAGADLAAQLALVSQWAGLAQGPQAARLPTPMVPATTTGTAATAKAAAPTLDALGIADKLATVRGGVIRPVGGTDDAAPLASAAAPVLASLDDALARVAKTTGRDTTPDAAKDVAASARDTEAVTARVPAAAVALAANFAAPSSLKDAVERTVGALETTPATNNTSLAATLLHTAASTADTAATAPTSLGEKVGTPAWTEEFGRAAVHVATTTLKEASLRLNPEHLGPLDVRVRIDDGVAHLAFQATHVDTRHALEASRPVLDQLFANQGLSIGDYSVDDRASGRASRDASTGADASTGQSGGGDRRSSGQGTTGDDRTLERSLAARLAKPLGLVDTFA